jgi:osmoprotectant transport system ATP-binding protein
VIVSQDSTAADALGQARKAGTSSLLVVDSERLPRGWVATDGLESVPGDTKLADVPMASYGHTFRVDTDSLRAALDATVLSPTGEAVGVDSAGRVAGVTTYDRLRAAIQGADEAGRAGSAAGSKPTAQSSPAPEGVPTS